MARKNMETVIRWQWIGAYGNIDTPPYILYIRKGWAWVKITSAALVKGEWVDPPKPTTFGTWEWISDWGTTGSEDLLRERKRWNRVSRKGRWIVCHARRRG